MQSRRVVGMGRKVWSGDYAVWRGTEGMEAEHQRQHMHMPTTMLPSSAFWALAILDIASMAKSAAKAKPKPGAAKKATPKGPARGSSDAAPTNARPSQAQAAACCGLCQRTSRDWAGASKTPSPWQLEPMKTEHM